MIICEKTARTIADQTEMDFSQRKRFYKSQVKDNDKSFASKSRLPDTWDQDAERKIGGDPRTPYVPLDTMKYHGLFDKRKRDEYES